MRDPRLLHLSPGARRLGRDILRQHDYGRPTVRVGTSGDVTTEADASDGVAAIIVLGLFLLPLMAVILLIVGIAGS
jgi:hypothetical protein